MNSRIRTILRGLPALLALGAGGCGGSSNAAPQSAPSPMLNQQVQFALPSDGGLLVTVPLTNAEATVVDAWAPTCEPCREKLPALVARKAELEAGGAKLVLVAVLSDGESTDDARAVLASWGVNAPFLVDRDGTLRREAGVTDLPAALLMNRDGVVRWVAPASSGADDIVEAAKAAR